MTRGQQNQPQRKRRKRAPGSLVAHRAFAPLLGLWGVALAGASVMVVPAAVFAGAIRGTAIAVLGPLAQPAIAGAAAVILGAGLFIIASAASRKALRRADTPSVAEFAVRRVIDPVHDLGSRSLDDPLDAVPFAAPAWQDEAETAAETETETEAGPEPAPLAMDLAAFADLPGRNGVWVEEQVAADAAPEDEPLAEPVAEPAPPVASVPVAALPLPEPGTAALARLRALPTSELSMAEMVERFAGALHEHRSSPPTRALSAADLAAREAALAEALKALAALSGDEASGNVREPLRAALAQLQTPRRVGAGAA